jgi:uncharacterized protein (DUF58 family)
LDEPTVRRAFVLLAACLSAVVGWAVGAPALLGLSAASLLLLIRSWRAARRRLRSLHAHRDMPDSAFEDEEVRVVLALENHGRAPVALVDVIDGFGPGHADRQSVLDPGPLAGGRRRRLAYRTTCSRLWGVYAVGPLTLRLSDALGLFTAARTLPDIRAFDLFPRVHPVGVLETMGSRASFASSDATAPRPGQSAAYLGVRDFRHGDDLRYVHWPATARRGTPMVKERELDLTPYFTLFLDLQRRNRAGTGEKSTLEYVVRTAAGLVSAAARRGDMVQAFAEGVRPLAIPPGRGELHLAHALDQLIRVRQDGTMDILDVLEAHHAALPPGSTAALLAATTFLDLGRLSEALDALRSRRVRALVVAVDKDSFTGIDRRPRPRAEVAAQREALVAAVLAGGARLTMLGADDELSEALARSDGTVGP